MSDFGNKKAGPHGDLLREAHDALDRLEKCLRRLGTVHNVQDPDLVDMLMLLRQGINLTCATAEACNRNADSAALSWTIPKTLSMPPIPESTVERPKPSNASCGRLRWS